MERRVVIAGAGQMGLVMADAALAAGIEDVVVWGRRPAALADMDRTRSTDRLPGWTIPAEIRFDSDPSVFGTADLLVSAVPTQATDGVWRELRDLVAPESLIVSTAKGLERGTLRRPSEILRARAPGSEVAVLSGPTIATELVRHQPAVMVAAAEGTEVAARVHRAFGTTWLRIYEQDDLLGVELAGALKNVIAIAAGICDGLDFGFNAKSALLARGLAEMTRLGVSLGAEPTTFFGIAGVGDLSTTCFSPDGRNRSCGEAIARGASVEDYVRDGRCVVEGIPTVESVVGLARARDVAVPITDAVHRIVFEGLDPRRAIQELMERPNASEGL